MLLQMFDHVHSVCVTITPHDRDHGHDDDDDNDDEPEEEPEEQEDQEQKMVLQMSADHVHNSRLCSSYNHWNQTALQSCAARSYQLQNFAILQPCGVDRFNGVEFVCCPLDKGQPPISQSIDQKTQSHGDEGELKIAKTPSKTGRLPFKIHLRLKLNMTLNKTIQCYLIASC